MLHDWKSIPFSFAQEAGCDKQALAKYLNNSSANRNLSTHFYATGCRYLSSPSSRGAAAKRDVHSNYAIVKGARKFSVKLFAVGASVCNENDELYLASIDKKDRGDSDSWGRDSFQLLTVALSLRSDCHLCYSQSDAFLAKVLKADEVITSISLIVYEDACELEVRRRWSNQTEVLWNHPFYALEIGLRTLL